MQCPKDRKVELVDNQLMGQLAVKHCPDCQGSWIPPEEYTSWQAQQPSPGELADLIDRFLDVEYTPAPLDAKAALCPECNAYLARARVNTRTPFYIERCPNCKGIWCDRDEWDTLVKFDLHTIIDQLFSNEWQVRTRERDQLFQERRATIDKLGPELADRIFELAGILEKHPNGDFGVAYLMRRFNQ